MAFLKLHQTNGTPLCLNLDKVEQFKSNGSGNTTIVFSELESMTVKESFEELEMMVNAQELSPVNLPHDVYLRGVHDGRY